MSALTSIFNFLYVYLRALICFLLGNLFDVSHFTDEQQREIAREIIITATNGQFQNGFDFEGEPILILVLGVFALGSIIGLVKRIMR